MVSRLILIGIIVAMMVAMNGMPPTEHLATAGAAVQRVLARRGIRTPTQLRHHVVLHDGDTGHVVVVPLPDGLVAPTVAALARQAAEVRARLSRRDED